MSTPAPKEWRCTFHAVCASGVLKAVPRSPTVNARGLLLRCLRALEALGYELTDLERLSDVHLQALARFWLHTDAPKPKCRARLEALHMFINELTGRAPCNGVTAHIACARVVLSACGAARRLCWSAVGIDVEAMLHRIALRDPYVAMQLSLQRAYGLGVAEVLNLRPHDANRQDCLVVESDQGERASFLLRISGGRFFRTLLLPLPIVLSGGFFLKTAFGNILFDPGMGTLTGMRDLGVDLRETDCIIVSHYHPSARFDLHTLLNELGGYCPGRFDGAKEDRTPVRRVHLFSSGAVIEGRNFHPKALIPSDERVTLPVKATPGQAWRVAINKNVVGPKREVRPYDPFPKKLPDDALLIQTFPAYHSEARKEGETEDADGMAEDAVSSVLVATSDYAVLFTGDTQYPEAWERDPTIKKFLTETRPITVLVANTKTIEYRPIGNKADAWPQLRLTKNQLGFEGTRRLAEGLKPKLLVVRGLGLECVVEEAGAEKAKKILRYAPERVGGEFVCDAIRPRRAVLRALAVMVSFAPCANS